MSEHMHRREFLRVAGSSLLVVGSAGPSAWARSQTAEPVLVVLFQRGAADALHMLVPYRDSNYRELRGALALDEPGRGESSTLDLGGGFAFHPALSPLYPLYENGLLAPIVNVGSHDDTRSHFDAQDFMESGTPGRKSTKDGWLTRSVAALSRQSASPFTAVSLTSQMPRSLAGCHEAIALEDFDEIAFPREHDPLLEQIERAYAADSALFANAGREAFHAMRLYREHDPSSFATRGGVTYPSERRENLAVQMLQLARLIKAGLGVRVAFIESGGWDTHFAQGGSTGQMAALMRDLAGSVSAFFADVGDAAPVTLLVATEFGRTVALNGANGTDHGHGGAMMVVGKGVRGGRVYGDWLGLDRRNLYQGRDLPVTTDFRDVFAEVARQVLGLPDSAGLFPDYDASPIGVMSSSSV